MKHRCIEKVFVTLGIAALAWGSSFAFAGNGHEQISESAYGHHGPGSDDWDGMHHYSGFDVELTDDVFISPAHFGFLTGGMLFPDDNEDGICDYAQDTEAFASLNLGEFTDENADSIYDPFQTREAYHALGMQNFTDIDGDGICDNYHAGNFFADRDHIYCRYNDFQVDMSDDLFVSPARFGFLTGGMLFPDDNEDGICDYAQDTEAFASLNLGEFTDENADGIYDPFQTREAYRALHLNNFTDVDGDGLCDNYRWNTAVQ